MVSRQKYFIFFSVSMLIVILIDQLTKIIVKQTQLHLNLYLFKIIYLTNSGAGFGILQHQLPLLTIISLLVLVVGLTIYKKVPQKIWPQLSVALFMGGTAGNLIDRLIRGYVIDFIDLTYWPAFNVADLAISLGIVGMVLTLWKNPQAKEN